MPRFKARAKRTAVARDARAQEEGNCALRSLSTLPPVFGLRRLTGKTTQEVWRDALLHASQARSQKGASHLYPARRPRGPLKHPKKASTAIAAPAPQTGAACAHQARDELPEQLQINQCVQAAG